MRITLASDQNMLRPQMQNSVLQKIVQQINADYDNKRNYDTVELNKKVRDLLSTDETKKTDEAETLEADNYQKYSSAITKTEWAENAVSEQRNGIKTVSDVIDHAKSKLKYTLSKIDELENYLNGSAAHSDPNMTKELAETYLHNYKQSISSDYTDVIQNHVNPHKSAADEYDRLSGGLASKVIDNQLGAISAESLGLSHLSGNPQEILGALENASKILNEMMAKVESAYAEVSGGKTFTEPARSTSIFDGNSTLSFFASQMEKSHKIVDMPLQFNGQMLNMLV